MKANHAGFSRQKSRTRGEPAVRPLDLSGLVQRLVWRRYQTDRIYRYAEQAFPPPDRTPAGRRRYREAVARLIAQHRRDFISS